MTDQYEDLLDTLRRCSLNDIAFPLYVFSEAATAIEELVADYTGQGEALIREVNAKLEAQMRAERAEADLAAARAALERIKSVARNPTTNERLSACWKIANEAAIAAARADGGE